MEPTQKPTDVKKPLIFIDMDGVLCDFVGGVLTALLEDNYIQEQPGDLLKRWQKSFPGEWDICKVTTCSNEDMWRTIHNIGKSFWSELEETSLYLPLRSLLKELEAEERVSVMVASSPSNNASSYTGKFEWLKSRRINAHSRAMLGSQKHLLAATGRILVDDNDDNCRRFKEHGGRAVLVPQIWNSLHEVASEGYDAQWHYIEKSLLVELNEARRDLI